MKRHPLVLLCGAVVIASATVLPAPSSRAEEDAGWARAELFLEAMGGRGVWDKVKFVHVEAIHDDVTIRDPFTNKIWNDFTKPRVRFEAKNAEIDRRRGINDGTGWRFRDGERKALTPEEVEEDLKWWEANIYRTLHRLAVKDPELTPRAVGEHRLEIFRSDGKRLNWFYLNQRGEPMLFGTWDSEDATVFGPLETKAHAKFPKWGARPDGSWRYEIVRLQIAEAAPSYVSFSEP